MDPGLRSRRVTVAVLSAAAVLAGCSAEVGQPATTSSASSSAGPVPEASSAPSTTPSTSTAPAPHRAPSKPPNPALARSAVAAVDRLNQSSVRYDVAVYDVANRTLTLGRHAKMPIMSASVIKLFVIVDLLHQRERGDITLSAKDVEWIQRALSGSDDNAMNALWSKYDGMQALRDLIDLVGLRETEVPDNPAQWGEATISAEDTIAVYRYLLTSLTAADRKLVLDAMSSPTHYGLADDFDQYFGLLGPGVRPKYVAAKQGWIGYRPYRLLHTTGLLGSQHQYVAVILTQQSNGISYSGASANVTEAAKVLLRSLGSAATR